MRDRELNDRDRALLGPMIRRSDNATAGVVLGTVGSTRLYRLARRAGMLDFTFAWPIWGNSTTSARDQARFFYRIDRLVPRRHQGYTRAVLASIVPVAALGDPAGAARPAGRSTSRAAGGRAPAWSRTSPRCCAATGAGSRSPSSRA